MESYKNLGGNSGVLQYEIGSDSIKVRFQNHQTYTYTYSSAGRGNVEHMKNLAQHGVGLNSFIDTNVQKMYSHKE
jgi:hypothetical protein